ncbi:MAG: HAMP domain-containing sensor histidine kinase [Clostridia bacterium]|nr:HAMP domain-containing sensor histidine kinase [Clostridia bacterium]
MMKTAFAKTFTYYIIVLLAVFFLLSLGFTEIFRGYFYNDQNDDLLNQAIKISDIYIQSAESNDFDNEYFKREIGVLDKYMDYSFIVTDSNMNVIAWSKDISSIRPKDCISRFSGYENVMAGKPQWIKGDIDNIYNQSRYILCYPTVQNGNVKAVVFVSVPLSELTSNINRVYIVVAFFLLLSVVLGFVTIHWTVNEFVIPIRKLSEAAKYISKGNFDEKIEIDDSINDELTQLCRSFNTMAENLAGLEKRRREIISNISHDLRSPITSVRGFLQAMLDGTISEDKYRHYIEIIYNETGRLQKLSDSILDLNKLDDSANALNMTSFDINAVADEAVKLMSGKADAKNIKLYKFCKKNEIWVYGDIEKIKRVIINLLDNGIKFTQGGYVSLSTDIEGNKAVISVEDTGIGLSEEEQSRVFERLYKADSSRGMDKNGSGLGLAIVKEFVKAHKQNIEIESKKGRGSKFTFTLDLSKKDENDV